MFRLTNIEDDLRKEQTDMLMAVHEKQEVIEVQEQRLRLLNSANSQLSKTLSSMNDGSLFISLPSSTTTSPTTFPSTEQSDSDYSFPDDHSKQCHSSKNYPSSSMCPSTNLCPSLNLPSHNNSSSKPERDHRHSQPDFNRFRTTQC